MVVIGELFVFVLFFLAMIITNQPGRFFWLVRLFYFFLVDSLCGPFPIFSQFCTLAYVFVSVSARLRLGVLQFRDLRHLCVFLGALGRWFFTGEQRPGVDGGFGPPQCRPSLDGSLHACTFRFTTVPAVCARPVVVKRCACYSYSSWLCFFRFYFCPFFYYLMASWLLVFAVDETFICLCHCEHSCYAGDIILFLCPAMENTYV